MTVVRIIEAMNRYAFVNRLATTVPALGPGLVTAALTALVAMVIGAHAPTIGGPVIAILIGIVLRALFQPDSTFSPGLKYSSKTILQAAIIFSGFGISFVSVLHTSVMTFPVTIATVAVAFLLTPIAGRLLHMNEVLRRLIGVGTAICGASAIAAVSAVIEPAEADLAVSIATIFIYNIAAVLIFPPIGHALHLSQAAFGIWAGTAINDTSSVVAAGYIYGHTAGQEATIVKLTRATLILPIVAVIAYRHARSMRRENERIQWTKIVPWFIVYFLIAAIINSTGIIPNGYHPALAAISGFLITMALAAIGLQTDWRAIARAGPKPLALGLVLWFSIAVTSLLVQRLTSF